MKELEGHEDRVSDVVFSPDGSILVSSSLDATVRLWDVRTGQNLATFREHHDRVDAIAFSADGTQLVSVNGTIWAPAPPLRFDEPGASPSITPEGELPARNPHMIILWDVATREEQTRWESGTPVFAVAFSPDGRTLATGHGDPMANIHGSVQLWNVATGEPRATLWERENATVWSVDFSPDGALIASGNGKGTTLWKVATHRSIRHLTDEMTGSVSFSPDGMLLASSTSHGLVYLWDTATYQMQASLDGHDGFVYDLAFSPDGTMLTSAGQDSTARLWDVETADELATIRIPRAWVGSVAFSPDGALLAAGSGDGLIRLWDVAELLGR